VWKKLTELCMPLWDAETHVVHRPVEKFPGVALGHVDECFGLDILQKAQWQYSVQWWLREEDKFEET
jgi:hypothetical protein